MAFAFLSIFLIKYFYNFLNVKQSSKKNEKHKARNYIFILNVLFINVCNYLMVYYILRFILFKMDELRNWIR